MIAVPKYNEVLSSAPKNHQIIKSACCFYHHHLVMTNIAMENPKHTVNGGFVRWENQPSIPWRTVSHNQAGYSPLVNVNKKLWKITMLLMGKSTISMAIFNNQSFLHRSIQCSVVSHHIPQKPVQGSKDDPRGEAGSSHVSNTAGSATFFGRYTPQR